VAPPSGRYGLEIRRAQVADAPFLAELLAAAGLPTAPALLAERLEAGRQEGLCLLASEWGPPSGVMVLHWTAPLHAPSTAFVSLLLVAPEARRRGVGRMLLKAGAQAARSAGCDRLELVASPTAQELAAFCRETGFEAVGEAWRRPLRRHR
jgi:aminoglycoside 6'-N-acetyltransferase I